MFIQKDRAFCFGQAFPEGKKNGQCLAGTGESREFRGMDLAVVLSFPDNPKAKLFYSKN